MAEYITKTDLLTYTDQEELDSITHKIGDEENSPTNIDVAIQNRCSHVNSLFANRYKVPFGENDPHITKALVAAICHLVLFDLLTGYASISDQLLNIRKDNAKRAEKFLIDIRDAKQDLITELNSEDKKTSRYFFNSDKRIDSSFH